MLKIKLKKKVALILCMIFTFCLLVPLSGCLASRPDVVDYRANWIYEGEDMTFIITTTGDSNYIYNGSISINGKTIDILIEVSSCSKNLSVYRSEGIDINVEDLATEYFDQLLFDCSYSNYKEGIKLTYFILPLEKGKNEIYPDKEIFLTRYDY